MLHTSFPTPSRSSLARSLLTLYKTSTFSPRNCSQLHPCARRPDVVLFPPSLHTSGSKAALNEEKKHHKREIENTRRRTRCLTHTLYIYHATTEKAMTLFVASCPSMRHLLLTSSRTKTGLCNILFPPFPRTKRGRRLDRQPNFAFNAYEPKEKEGFPLHIPRRRRRVAATKASRYRSTAYRGLLTANNPVRLWNLCGMFLNCLFPTGIA